MSPPAVAEQAAKAAVPVRAPALTPAKPRIARPTATLHLGADASQLLSEQIALRQLASDTALQLSDDQWSALAAVVSHHQAIRHAYEASIARVTSRAEGMVRAEIPAYPAAGDSLRARLYGALEEKLGPAAASAIAQELGGAIEGQFAGFGVSVQTLDFSTEAGAVAGDVQVTRTIKFWNSVTAGERLTERRDVHFPRLEDPSGHQWGPFLAVLAAATGAKAGS